MKTLTLRLTDEEAQLIESVRFIIHRHSISTPATATKTILQGLTLLSDLDDEILRLKKENSDLWHLLNGMHDARDNLRNLLEYLDQQQISMGCMNG